MSDTIPPEAFLAAFPPAIATLGEELRDIVTAAIPGAIERVRPGWHLIGYEVPDGRRNRYFAYIAPEAAHIHLGFEYGVSMSDPMRRLSGAGITRQVRWLTYEPGDRIDAEVAAEFVREAARVACLSAAERLAIAFDREP